MERAERSGRKSFFTLEQIKHRIYVSELEKRHEELEQQALLKQAEINFEENINPRARKADKQLEQIRLAKKRKKRTLITESNETKLGEHDFLDRLHKATNDRFSRKWTDKLHRTMYQHEHPPRTGWGPHRNLTREEYRKYFFSPAAGKFINNMLSLAEERDNKPKEWEQLELF